MPFTSLPRSLSWSSVSGRLTSDEASVTECFSQNPFTLLHLDFQNLECLRMREASRPDSDKADRCEHSRNTLLTLGGFPP